MGSTSFQNIRACVFDAYGTLFDVHSALTKFSERLGNDAKRLSTIWRTKQLEYTWLRSLMRQHADFWRVTQDALNYALESVGVTDNHLKEGLMDAYLNLDCYPEIFETLNRIKKHGLPRAILSNGSPSMLNAVVKKNKLEKVIDMILSVEEVGVYKPDPRVYQLAVDKFGIEANKIIYLSSNAWDVAGATCFGFCVVWINRFNQLPERLPFQPQAEIKSLHDLPPLLGF